MKNIETDITMLNHFKDVLKLANADMRSRSGKALYTIHVSRFDVLSEEEVLSLLEYNNILVIYFKKVNGKPMPRRKHIKEYLIKHKPQFYEKYKLLFSE